MMIAILLAAGKGLRLQGSTTPKQFVLVKRKPLYQYALETFVQHNMIDEIVLVVQDESIPLVQDQIKRQKYKKVIHVVAGGKYRQESSYLALNYLFLHQQPDYVIIHDVARPLVTPTLIDDVCKKVKTRQAVTLGRKVNDSLFVKKEDDRLESYLSKNEVYLVQTPQAFNFKLILEAHEHARQLKIKQAIDDASLLTLMEQDVYVLPGKRYNFKVVTQDDLSLFKFIKENA
jgi:2-C-methyl-D-erythritol 4-phosphate cytidylyltransferase